VATTKNIQSVERALSILEIFKAGKKELSVKEISEEVGLSKSTAFGLINTLTNQGYLQQNSENLKYGLGLKVLALSNTVQKNNIIVQTIRPYLISLSDKFQETTHCAVEENASVIYIDKIEAKRSVYIKSEIGTKNYMHCAGVGKCFLAYMSQKKFDKIIEGNLISLTPNTITDKEKLKIEMADIRLKGFAVDREEIELGLTCVAVPILSIKKEPIVAISLSGPTSRMNEMNIEEIGEYLKRISAKIALELNY